MKTLLILLSALGILISNGFAQVVFRLKYVADDLDLKNPANHAFQINTLDVRTPSTFLKIGDTIPKTKLKLERFEQKSGKDPHGKEIDLPELTLRNTATGEIFVLPWNKIVNVPGAVKGK